ncbi:MAG: platelet-activating factor acetylhydrolase, plasma/intracellular isoform [Clostridia bacterium]|jgi:dienelactone hydrolase|nr:platelet-activating factor acetylhydrolase, plasma/intracellular isoform [Clostridia bacterium]
MLGNIISGVLIGVEIVFVILTFLWNSNLKREKSIVRIAFFTSFLFLVVTSIIEWGFQWYTLGLLLGIQSLLGMLVFVRKKENSVPKKSMIIFAGLNRVLLIVMAVLPILIFPQYNPIEPTGEYSVGTKSYTLKDELRKEDFTEADDNRQLTIQYWFPADKSGQEESIATGKFPLLIFSHGAFGYRMSNYSTYQELASHGYIVASIDHTYHAFMTKQEDGKAILANFDFVNSAMGAQMGAIEAKQIYELEQKWMKLRTEDIKFVLDYIKKSASSANSEPVYKSMDPEHIGVFGHSLGGAAAAKIGRDVNDVDAVIVIDGTMMGEITGFKNGKEIVTDVPYPKPIMNIYSEYHYNDALSARDVYPNMIATKNALNSYQMVIKGSGHMNFTDLAIISPFLSRRLETGGKAITVDARYCIETTNEAILQFFDYYLKAIRVEIPKERIL